VGINYVITTGNEADLNYLDFLEYMIEDEHIKVLATYIEGVKDGKKLMDLAQKSLERRKPILALKVGRSESAQKAAMSHTGSLTGSDAVFDAACKQYGLIRVNDIDQIVETAQIFLPGRWPKGNNVAVVTTSGGPGIILADACSQAGLNLPSLEKANQDAIMELIPFYGSANNPIDITAQVINNPDSFRQVLEIVLQDPNIDALIVSMDMYVGQLAQRIAEDVVEIASHTDKPVLCSWPVSQEMVQEAFATLSKAEVPRFRTPERAAQALGALCGFTKAFILQSPRVKSISAVSHVTPRAAVPATGGTEYEMGEVFRSYGIPVAPETLAVSPTQAVKAAEEIGYPVALKILSPDIHHKTEVGGLKLGLRDAEAVSQGFFEIMEQVLSNCPKADITGVVVQKMVPQATEVIVGAINDPVFGPVVLFGLGGIYVEILRDVVYRVAPFNAEEARRMILETKASRILLGARGKKAADLDAWQNSLPLSPSWYMIMPRS
jgi:acyl-CoA synthetase (NDP forming)